MDIWSFHIGSCALKAWPFYLWSFNIFNTMEHRPSDFMLWTGDHVYMLKPWQWESAEAMRKAYLGQRKNAKLKGYMDSRPQYAIWDDHDFGPNNAGSEFVNKDTALKVFREMWPNQPQASDKGIYYTFEHKDAALFMMDGRYFKVVDSQLFGDTQLKWLCEELKKSKAPFKFICMGIQAISDGPFENFRKFEKEYTYFMKFIEDNKIEGIVFMSGDVHYSEVSRMDRVGAYPIYDFTLSPLTSFPINFFTTNSYQIDNSKRNVNNFGEVRFSGEIGARICTIDCIGRLGEILWSYDIKQTDLTYPK